MSSTNGRVLSASVISLRNIRLERLPHSIVERAVEILSYQVPVRASLYNPLVGKGIRHICENASLAWVERQ